MLDILFLDMFFGSVIQKVYWVLSVLTVGITILYIRVLRYPSQGSDELNSRKLNNIYVYDLPLQETIRKKNRVNLIYF